MYETPVGWVLETITSKAWALYPLEIKNSDGPDPFNVSSLSRTLSEDLKAQRSQQGAFKSGPRACMCLEWQHDDSGVDVCSPDPHRHVE